MTRGVKYRLMIIGQLCLLSLYLICYVMNMHLTDISLTIHNIYVGLSILYIIRKEDKFRINWMLLAWGVLTASIIDVFEFILDLMMIGLQSNIVSSLNLIPNLLLLFSALLYFKQNFKNWHKKQLTMDMIMFFIIILGISSALFFSSGRESNVDYFSYIVSMSYLAIDIIIVIIMLSMIISINLKAAWKHISLVSLGYLFFVLSDYLYIDQIVNNTEDLYSLIAISYIFSCVCFFYGAIRKEKNRHLLATITSQRKPDNFGKSRHAWLIIVIPVILFVLGRVSSLYLISFLLVIVIYQILSSNIQKIYMTEKLLEQEINLKKYLEEMVLERTNALIESNKKLEQKSNIDYLTGLYNRSSFLSSINEGIECNHLFTILFLDLDRFKIINDLHGHPIGDKVLITIANRFLHHKELPKIIGRIGGDEFAMMIPSVDSTQIESTCEVIDEVVSHQIVVDDLQFIVNTSIGIARFPEDGKSSAELLKHADIAMYHAKSMQSRKRYIFYSSNFTSKIERRNRIEWLLRNCDYDNEFQLYYQPQFRTDTRQIIAMEALLRWNHPIEGAIPPDEFIPIAEEIGVIVPISYWVFDRAMKQIKLWNELHNKKWVMGINLSPVSLNHIDFFKTMQQMISEIGISPTFLDFEITEHSAMNLSNIMEDIFEKLRELGVSVSIDDFGTGYSSLSYLKRFKVHRIKIAKELIDNIEQEQDELQIVKAIIMMCEGLGINMIAEGVETKEQLHLLESIRCEAIQGYIFGRPVPANTFEKQYLEVCDEKKT